MDKQLSLGFSPCPNDTYIFYALVHNHIPLDHVSFSSPVLEDVETLNLQALEEKLDVTKLSFHAAGHVLDKYVILSSGAALGRGCGPLLVTRSDNSPDLEQAVVAIPGNLTTAAMLLKLYEPAVQHLQVMRFEEIMPAVAAGKVDAGVIIHESRFTYQDMGLVALQDLGLWWEELTGLPIPLGCIAARRSLSGTIIKEIDDAICASLRWARDNTEECMKFIRSHAQEMQDNVLQSHIGLYVNEFSEQIGDEGKAAVEELLNRGMQAGVFSATDVAKAFVR